MAADPVNIGAELARLQGTMEKGFENINGQLKVLVERSKRTEQDIDDLETRVTMLERQVWRTAGAAAAVGVAAPYLLQLISR